MTLHPPRNRFFRYTIYFICFILIFLAVDLVWVQSNRTIHPGYETTRIVEPLLENGSIDYLTAVENYYSRGVTPENNAAIPLLEAFGRSALARTQPPDGITSRLGMPHLPDTGDYFVTFATFAKDTANNDDISPDRHPWLSKPTPIMIDWLKANEKPLSKVIEATSRSRFFIPFNGGNRPGMLVSVLLPHLHLLGEAATALMIRASLDLDAGNADACQSDLMAVHRLARLIGQAPTLVERALAQRMEIDACAADRTAAASGKSSAQQLRKFASDLSALPELSGIAGASNVSERYMFLDALQCFTHLNPAEAGKLWSEITSYRIAPPWLFYFLPIPYDESMKVANHWHDGYLAAISLPTYGQRRAALLDAQRTAMELAHHGHFGPLSPTWGLSIFLPALDRIQQRWETSRAEDRLTVIALSLSAYKLDHGSFPQLLSELKSNDLRSVPTDNFSDRPFIYSRTETGYVLYSVGPNVADDGGTGDDIVAGPVQRSNNR